MSSGSFSDRTRLMMLSMHHARRAALGKVLKSPLYRWRYAGTTADRILLMPQDLRTADPSFATEVYHGQFGLAGAMATTNGASPFAIHPPDEAWEKELHGFTWLRHYSALDDDESKAQARALVRDWLRQAKQRKRSAWTASVVSRRLISWLSHMGHFMDESDPALYDAVMRSLTEQMRYLAGYYAETPDGHPRLIALIALVMCGLCVANQDTLLLDYLDPLCSELDRQILKDGSHISRNPWVPVSLMLDLLPLRQCFISREREVPDEIVQTLQRILPMLRFLRLGDGTLARFNGMAATLPDSLATVLSYDDLSVKLKGQSKDSGYCRLELGKSVVITDVGFPPPLQISSSAHAGCLSFEMTSGAYPIIINSGAPGPANTEWRFTARTTPYHSTLSINNHSSARLLKRKFLERYLDGALLQGPDDITCDYKEENGQVMVAASHDGFESKYRVIYGRKLTLMDDGDKLVGEEYLVPSTESAQNNANSFPFVVHFHIHPDVEVALTPERDAAQLSLYNGEIWQFSAENLLPALEESMFFADFRGPRRTIQIALRGVCKGHAKFSWSLEKIQKAAETRTATESSTENRPTRADRTQQKLIFFKDEKEDD